MQYSTSYGEVTLKIIQHNGYPTIVAVDSHGDQIGSPFICSFTPEGIKLYSGFEDSVEIKRRNGSSQVNVYDAVTGRNLELI